MPEIVILPPQENWLNEFQEEARAIREALGDTALAIHHIGSTSVPAMPAKDVLDMQITVKDLALVEGFRGKLEALGFRYREHIHNDHCPLGMELAEAELAKRVFRKEERRINCHIRVHNTFNQRYALLCRDYLRANAMAANAYAEIKQQLAHYFPDDVEAYYAIKDPVFDVIMAGAFHWAEATAWQPAASDA